MFTYLKQYRYGVAFFWSQQNVKKYRLYFLKLYLLLSEK